MKNHYFVIVPEHIIAQDLAHTIRAVDPQAEVSLFQRLQDAMSALVHGRPLAMFLHHEPRLFLGSAEGQALSAEGIPVAFLGMTAEVHGEGAVVLASPFSESSVEALLRRLTGPFPGPATEG